MCLCMHACVCVCVCVCACVCACELAHVRARRQKHICILYLGSRRDSDCSVWLLPAILARAEPYLPTFSNGVLPWTVQCTAGLSDFVRDASP